MRTLSIASTLSLILALTFATPGLAWNKAGHMVSGAIAYTVLKKDSPGTLDQVVQLLKKHPFYESRWQRQIADLPPDEQELKLFMLASHWSDDVRGNREFDHPAWHYINLPFKPAGQPDSVHTFAPASDNILRAFKLSLDILKSNQPDSSKAVASAWIFHLVGDVHQPLHTTSLFTTGFPAPLGDRGGTRFYIRARAGNRPISLHQFWDGLILGSSNDHTVRNLATKLRLQPELARNRLPELKNTNFENWARVESFTLAKEVVYRGGQLQGSPDKELAPPLPADYTMGVKPVAERQIVLAGYRLAEVLREVMGK